MIDPVIEIEDLVAFAERRPGSDAERRAAGHLKRRLEELGRDAEVEPTWIFPSWAAAHALHAVLAVVGSAIAVKAPLAGTIVIAVALLATVLDLTGTVYAFRRLFGRRASQNVTSREQGGRPGTLLLVAHYDAGRGGAVFGRMMERRAALARRIRRPIGGFGPLVVAMLIVLGCAIARTAGAGGTALAVAQFVPTVFLIVCVPLLADLALAGVVPGANDNASGVATALRLAERYGGDLDHFDVHVVLTGAGEAMQQGMRCWIRRHRRDLDAANTVVVNLDEVGAGTVRYATREGVLLGFRYHPQLTGLCDQIRDEDADEDRYGARPVKRASGSDALVARSARLPAISISCAGPLDIAPDHHRATDTVDRLDEDALDRAFGFCSELIELIDERLGPQLPARTAESFNHA